MLVVNKIEMTNKIYKYVTFLMLLLAFTFNSCSDNELEPEVSNESVDFLFEESDSSSQKSNENSFQTITVVVEYIDGLPKLVSNQIEEIPVILESTDNISYGYVLKKPSENQQKSTSIVEPGIRMGYGFDGRCFVYGTFVEDDNGNTLFWECGPLQGCLGFTRYCPSSSNEAFAYNVN